MGMVDTWDRVNTPVKMALDTAAMTMDAIDQVILVGGGSRVPKVQELLTQYVGRELGKNLNTDESAAMGAVYKAADLSSGFKVKKFITKEAVIFPLDVNFERELDGEEGETKKSSSYSVFKDESLPTEEDHDVQQAREGLHLLCKLPGSGVPGCHRDILHWSTESLQCSCQGSSCGTGK